MWSTLKIESMTEKKLSKDLPNNDLGKILYRDYLDARKNLCENVLNEIKAKLPDYTDHGQSHIENVLTNAQDLLGDDISRLGGIDLYCLLMSILFHDTGNFFDRKDHQNNIGEIYSFARSSSDKYRLEQILITKIVQAHCGNARDNTKDTLQFVDPMLLHDVKCYVKSRDLAAIVRFADELAEGPQRTSSFRLQKDDYPDGSKIYNHYANVTNIHIDRKLERIALIYNIDIKKIETEADLETLLTFIYGRIIKLDQERRYTKHYCDLLLPFKKITVSFNFWSDAKLLDLELNSLTLTDLVVPEDKNKTIDQYDSEYNISNILQKIKNIQNEDNQEDTSH